MSDTKSYLLVAPLRHQGKLFEVGDTVKLAPEIADALGPSVIKLKPTRVVPIRVERAAKNEPVDG